MSSTNSDLPQPQNTFQINQDDKFFTRLLARDAAAAGFNSPPPPFTGRHTATVPFNWESQPGTPKNTTATGNKSPHRNPLPLPPSHQHFPKISPKDKSSPSSQFNTPKIFSHHHHPIKLRQSRSLHFSTLLAKLISLKKNLMLASEKNSPSRLLPSLTSNSSKSWSSSSSSGFFVPNSRMNQRRKSRFATPESSFDSKTEDDEEDEDDGGSGSPTSTLCFATGRCGRGFHNFRLSGCYGGKI